MPTTRILAPPPPSSAKIIYDNTTQVQAHTIKINAIKTATPPNNSSPAMLPL